MLYAEDEALTRQVLCEVLATKVRAVFQAADGQKGLEIFKKYRPDVVLVDNNMPTMDGLSLAKALRSIDPSLPIIVVSGDIRRQNLQQMECMQLHFIKKPIRIRQLLQMLEQFNRQPISSSSPALSSLPRFAP